MTFQDIAKMEYKMLMDAENKYGQSYMNCLNMISLMQDFISSSKMESWIFNVFLSYIKKHIVLSFFSALRLHHVQSCADLRHVLEATSLACYALAFPQESNFVEKSTGRVNRTVGGKSYKWLEKNYPDASKAIGLSKKYINNSCAHANLIYAFQDFKILKTKREFNYSFFDRDDLDLVKGDLWGIAHVAGNIMDIFYGVNKDYNFLTFPDDFIPVLRKYRINNDEIKKELMSKERFKRYIITAESGE